MPTKIKPSVKHYDRKTGKYTIEHFYIKNSSYQELEEIMKSERANAKLRIKCKREIIRRIKNGRYDK